jgi:pyoverdine/dityrosine biosynthesis protein Dit1
VCVHILGIFRNFISKGVTARAGFDRYVVERNKINDIIDSEIPFHRRVSMSLFNMLQMHIFKEYFMDRRFSQIHHIRLPWHC